MSRHSRGVNTAAGRHLLFMLIRWQLPTWCSLGFCKLPSLQSCTLHQYTFCFRSACRPDAGQLHSPPAASKVSYTAILLQVSYTALLLQVKSVTRPSCSKSSQLHSPPAASQLYNPHAVIQANSLPVASQSHNPHTASQSHNPHLQVSYTALLFVSMPASQLHSLIHTLFRVVKQRIQMVLRF